VANPLPAKVLDGSPCDSAYTATQLTGFLGATNPPKPSTDQLGTACYWSSANLDGAALSVGYQVKVHDGISLAYQSVKPTAVFWKELAPVQGYPIIAYKPAGDSIDQKDTCTAVVGINDELAYAVVVGLGDHANAQGKNACDSVRTAADAVMTNLKARAS
jgi:hypothetical protein